MRKVLTTLIIISILGITQGTGIVSGQVIPDPTWLGPGNHDIDLDLGMGEIEAFIISIEKGDRVVVDLMVTEGSPADFYSLNNYSLYLMVKDDPDLSSGTNDLYFMEEGEYTRTSSLWISYEYTALYDDTIIILVDNSNMVENGASPTGDIVVSGTIDVKESVWTMENIIITLVIIVVIIIIFIGFRIPAKRKKEAEQKAIRQAAMARQRVRGQQVQQAKTQAQPRKMRRIRVVKTKAPK